MKSSLRYYLIAYNLIAFLFWLAYLIAYMYSGFVLSDKGLILLNIAQGMAILEILHAFLKWVKSPIVSTLAQVSSRLMVLVLINLFSNESLLATQTALGIQMVSFAWGITELVRYKFYFFAQFGLQFKLLVWMRYSFFILLYPIGVTGEWVILSAPLFAYPLSFSAYNMFLLITFAAYIYFFPQLFGYMWKQRKAKV